MPTKKLNPVTDPEMTGKKVLDLTEIRSLMRAGFYSYTCSACGEFVVRKSDTQLLHVVLQCPGCGAFGKTGPDAMASED